MIKNIDIIKSEIPNFSFSDIEFLREFHLQMLDDGFEKSSILDIVFIITVSSNRKYSAKLRFYNPQSIRFECGGTIHQVSLDIKNISERGWENLNLEVIDYETGDIHFFSSSAEVLSIKKTFRDSYSR